MCSAKRHVRFNFTKLEPINSQAMRTIGALRPDSIRLAQPSNASHGLPSRVRILRNVVSCDGRRHSHATSLDCSFVTTRKPYFCKASFSNALNARGPSMSCSGRKLAEKIRRPSAAASWASRRR